MKKKSTSQSAFFNLRILIGLFLALAGGSLLAFTGNYEYVGTAPTGCGLLVGSGLTCGWPMNTWSEQLATNTVQYTFAMSQPAPKEFALFETHDPWRSTFIKDAITATGHTYQVFTPDKLAGFNFSEYRVVILNWDDTFLNEFITPYTAAITLRWKIMLALAAWYGCRPPSKVIQGTIFRCLSGAKGMGRTSVTATRSSIRPAQ